MKTTKSFPNAWLKPCPFCDTHPDQEAILFEYFLRNNKNEVAIICSKCGIRGPMKPMDLANKIPEIKAIQWWNQRGTPMTQEIADRLYKELDDGWEKAHHNDYFIDDGGTAEVVESALQHMWVRVGPVFNGDKGQDKEDGIWIETQPIYYNSSIDHNWLLSKETWDKLNKFIQKKFRQIKRWKEKYKEE